ncbi:MAG: ferritin [Sphaerochaetaceae bacterium]
MLDKRMEELLNKQINKELYSAYLYLYFANFYIEGGLNGFANWYQVQEHEERDHAMLLMRYLQDNGGKVSLESVAEPEGKLEGFVAPVKQALVHEQYITDSIHAIYDVAWDSKDYRTMQFLDWFVKEQGEEEKNAVELLRKTEFLGSDSKGLYLLDKELASRTYSVPSRT